MPTVIDLGDLGSLGFSIQGDSLIDWAGWRVSEAGDVNGDGFDDILVGAPLNVGAGDIGGSAYLIFGRSGGFGNIDLSNLAASDGFAIKGDGNSYYTGQNISGAGDVNGDGFDDLIVSGVDSGPSGARGSAYVIFGKATGFGTVVLTSLAPSDGFIIQGEYTAGRLHVSSAGDVNGDGFDDMIVGARLDNNAAGSAYVIFGKAAGFGTIDLANLSLSDGFAILGAASGDRLGRSVSDAGDVNGDGFDDLIVGAYQGDDGGTDAGEAYVIFGKASGLGTIDLTGLTPSQGFIIQGDTAGDWAGFSVASAGDVNGDGFDDLIVGAPHGDDGGTDAGEAYVIFGKASGLGTIDLTSLTPSQGFIIRGDNAGDNAGFSVSAAGDVNDDGFDDLIVGAPYGDDGGTDAGEAYVLFGHADGFETIDLTNLGASDGFVIQGDAAGDNAGWSVSALGDINGDGAADVVVGAPLNDDGGTEAGKAYVIFGGLNTTADLRHDFNGDGRDDILWRHDSGLVTDWLGTASGGFANNFANVAVNVATSWQVAGTGDFNGDGRDDILWRHNSGLVTDWLGTASGGFADNFANAAANVATSWHVASTGDFNGDGKDDILWRHDSGLISEWLGTGSGGFADNYANASSNVATSWKVIGAGDFNGDGRADILWRHDSGLISQWLGTASGGFADNYGNASTNVATSWRVAGIGDFNGDDRDDILWRHDSGLVTNWLGEADGGFAPNNANALAQAAPGWSVAGTGDYNGDGRDDILWRHDNGLLTEWLGISSGGFIDNGANAFANVSTAWDVQPDHLI